MRNPQRALEPHLERRADGAGRHRERQRGQQSAEAWAEAPEKIGPAALVAPAAPSENRKAVEDRLSGVLTEIRSLLDLPADREPPPRAVVEDTLTSGYAAALALEGERLRAERELRDVLRARTELRRREREAEIAGLTERLDNADRELAGLRALLSSLRAQAL
jgi:hypothetical protein